jgi:hypothetical protein
MRQAGLQERVVHVASHLRCASVQEGRVVQPRLAEHQMRITTVARPPSTAADIAAKLPPSEPTQALEEQIQATGQDH